MPKSVLITECLQNDFVKPLPDGEPLPNLLHVGRDEARRLMGENPAEGPVAQVMSWAYNLPPEDLLIIHLRDWHDESDDFEGPHLEQFGRHCLAGTEGAAFAFLEPEGTKGRAQIVDALTLNDFHGTRLSQILKPLAGQKINVGLMGVWTEAKVLFLAYELITRYPGFSLAICSALTASSSRARHFLALDQLERILGAAILDSVGEFVEFLGGRARDLPRQGFTAKHPELSIKGDPPIQEADRMLLRYLFRDCRTVDLSPLSGGFSGNPVLAARSVDMHGHQQAPHVVKVGPQDLIGRERTAFERIEQVLGNNAPRMADFADLDGRGGLKYRYASMGGGDSRTFKELYTAGLSQNRINAILKAVFSEQLGRLYAAAQPQSMDLLDYYGFSPEWAPNVRSRVESIAGPEAGRDFINFPGGRSVPNVCLFYESLLPALPRPQGVSHYIAFVHGDLNGANIVVDGRGNIWLIDFFHTHQGHVLRDLIKLENDLLYIFTPLSGEQELAEACRVTDLLLDTTDLANPLPYLDRSGVRSPDLLRALETIRFLRSYYPDLVREDRDPLQLFIGQLRYAVHTLSFDESSEWQKKWALYASGRLAELIVDRVWHQGPLRIDWLDPKLAGGFIGLTILPGRRDRGRSLPADLAAMKQNQVTDVVCLLTDQEFSAYGVENLLFEYDQAGFSVKCTPIPDQEAPSFQAMKDLDQWISRAVERGGRVMIHCVGGLGRSGLAAACYLKSRGLSFEQAVAEVRTARSPRAIETEEQMDFVRAYN